MRMFSSLTVTIAVAIQSQLAHAVCLNPFGCAPANYDECLNEATKRPTDVGVKFARSQCYDKWKLPEIEKVAALKAAAADKRALTWAAMEKIEFNAEAWIKQLGQPDLVLGPSKCSLIKGVKPTKGQSCYTYYWYDERPGRVSAHFKAEVLNESGKPLWAYWPDSFTN
jgi:hypothetical protein